MNDDLSRAKQRLLSALVVGTNDQFDYLKQIFEQERGDIRPKTKEAMETIIDDLKELLD